MRLRLRIFWCGSVVLDERVCELKDLDADRSLMNTRAIELLSGHFGVAAGLFFHCASNRANPFIQHLFCDRTGGLKVKYMIFVLRYLFRLFSIADMTMMIAIMELNGEPEKRMANNNNKNNSNHF